MTFYCVNDCVPRESVEYLEQACSTRNIPFTEIDAALFDPDLDRKCNRGDLLFRPAISFRAIRAEQSLYDEGVATFYADPEGPLFTCANQNLAFTRVGLPLPRYYTCLDFVPEVLLEKVNYLGGFPIVVKILGGSSGIGVIRVDSPPAMLSLVEYLIAQGQTPILSTYIEDAIHWRLVVVGNKAIAAYQNPKLDDDFRTFGSTDTADITNKPDERLELIAVNAVHALRLEFGGVDLLLHESGRIYLLEANFPCYFAHAQIHGGIDVAGEMVDYLLRKSLILSSQV